MASIRLSAASFVVFTQVGCDQHTSVSDRVTKVSEAAYAAHPEDPIAGSNASADAVDKEIASSIPAGSGRQLAAAAFVGYYAKNVYSFETICAESGVRLTSYPARFAELNRAPLQVASRYVDVRELVDYVKATNLTAARRELDRMVAMDKSDLRHVCTFMQDKGNEIAASEVFSRVAPKVYAMLMGAT